MTGDHGDHHEAYTGGSVFMPLQLPSHCPTMIPRKRLLSGFYAP
jgi:hypothetical protein